MVVLCTGSRSLSERRDQFMIIVDAAFRVLLKEAPDHGLDGKITLVKHGGARGVDLLCDQWAKDMSIPTQAYPAKWHDWYGLPESMIFLKHRSDGSVYNALAGMNRNREMIESGFDVGLAIRMPGRSPGTDDATRRMKDAGKPVLIYRVDGGHEWH